MTQPNWRAHCKNNPLAVALNEFGLLKITGKEASTFLQGQLTCEVSDLNENVFSFAACCDHKGRMVANFYIFHHADEFLLFMPHTMLEPTLEHLQKYAAFSQVTLSIADNKLIGLIAPNKMELISLAPFSVTTRQNCQLLTLPGELMRMIIVGSVEDSSQLLTSLNVTLEKNKQDRWQWFDIENCMTFILPTTSLKFTPQMISLEKWGGVSFSKGCYVGQEVIARTQHLGKLKRHLQHAEVKSSKQPQAGDQLVDQDGQVLGLVAQCAVIEEGLYALLAVIQDRASEGVLYLQGENNQLK